MLPDLEAADVLLATVKTTVPFPVTLLPLNAIHEEDVTGVHEQLDATANVPLPPVDVKLAFADDNA